jgi:uncharacterized protein (DUF362 family)
MGAIYEEFAEQLARWRQRYARRPDEEMARLFLVALEREELVSVGYRETAIVRRLRTMPLEPAIRDLIHHALLWAWKDEEMHSVYIRGAILKLGRWTMRPRARLHQLAGAVGGWSASVCQHARWRDAPLARLFATANTWAGALLGKVPADVRRHLRYGPFRHFCLFNVDAERTAWLCWRRLVELADFLPGLSPHLADDFRHIAHDEECHTQIFQILADALGEDDRLVPDESAETLARKIADVGPFFLPRGLRPPRPEGDPIGRGGTVCISRGARVEDKIPLFHRLLEDAGLDDCLRQRARALGKPVEQMRVAVKPTFMLGYQRRDLSNVTDPVLVAELAGRLRRLGCADVAVVEAPTLYDRFYHNRSVAAVASYFGFASPHYRLVDLSQEQVGHAYERGMAQYTVGRTWKEADFRITFGKLRSHPIEIVHLGVGNLEWIGARCDEYIFPERQAHRETSVMMILDAFPPHFSLLDGYDQVADGLAGMMGCPRPLSPHRLYAGADALAVDLVAGRHLGLKDERESRILSSARQWLGDPRGHTRVDGPDEPVPGWRSPYYSDISTLLSFFAYPVYQFGSARGALFVPEMDEGAFPPLRPEGFWLRLARRAIQTLLGLRRRK